MGSTSCGFHLWWHKCSTSWTDHQLKVNEVDIVCTFINCKNSQATENSKKMSEHDNAINKGNQKTILFFIIVPMTDRQDRQKKEEEKRMRLGKKREKYLRPKLMWQNMDFDGPLPHRMLAHNHLVQILRGGLARQLVTAAAAVTANGAAQLSPAWDIGSKELCFLAASHKWNK